MLHDWNSYGFCLAMGRRGDEFLILVGLDWDQNNQNKYIALENTAFADYVPLPKFRYQTAHETERAMCVLSDWMQALCAARPASKKFLANSEIVKA